MWCLYSSVIMYSIKYSSIIIASICSFSLLINHHRDLCTELLLKTLVTAVPMEKDHQSQNKILTRGTSALLLITSNVFISTSNLLSNSCIQ